MASPRSRSSEHHGVHPAQGSTITLAANTEDKLLVWRNNTGSKVKIGKAAFTPDETLTGADTNSVSLQFQSRLAAGGASKNITAVKAYTSGVDIAQFVEDALVLSTTAADLEVDDGELVILDVTMPGTGLALPAGLATLEFEFIA